MSYLLRNDDTWTVRVSYTRNLTYLSEVHHGLESVIHYEHETAQACLDMVAPFVDHHISSRYLWALTADASRPVGPLPKSEAYTDLCREKVEKLYKRAA